MRPACEADIPALTAIKGKGSEALHRDRLRFVQEGGFHYQVLLVEEELVGFACLVFRRPASWSDGEDTSRLPQIVDLQVKESQRGRGYGSAFIRLLEQQARQAGYRQIYLAVEPLANPRAFALYRRLGYQPLQDQPYHTAWQFQDSQGKVHRGEMWVVDMLKRL